MLFRAARRFEVFVYFPLDETDRLRVIKNNNNINPMCYGYRRIPFCLQWVVLNFRWQFRWVFVELDSDLETGWKFDLACE